MSEPTIIDDIEQVKVVLDRFMGRLERIDEDESASKDLTIASAFKALDKIMRTVRLPDAVHTQARSAKRMCAAQLGLEH